MSGACWVRSGCAHREHFVEILELAVAPPHRFGQPTRIRRLAREEGGGRAHVRGERHAQAHAEAPAGPRAYTRTDTASGGRGGAGVGRTVMPNSVCRSEPSVSWIWSTVTDMAT